MENIQKIRAHLGQLGLDGMIIPHNDRFQGEYLTASEERLTWATGFSGSAGIAIITQNHAAIFVDGRYTLQAAMQVDQSYFTIEDLRYSAIEQWLEANAAQLNLGFDPWLFSFKDHQAWSVRAQGLGFTISAMKTNPIDTLWADRPASPKGNIQDHPIAYSGQESQDKCTQITKRFDAWGINAYLFTSPESTSWLLNLRGNHVPHTPVVNGYVLLTQNGDVTLYADTENAPKYIKCLPENALREDLKNSEDVLSCCPETTPYAITQLIKPEILKLIPDPATLPRACKNKVEQQGAINAHVRDGAAIIETLAWIDEAKEHKTITEIDVVDYLYNCRAKQPLFKDISFYTIAASGPNGAIVHYRPTPETNRDLKDTILLLDSGGQYLDGTTDITRTIALSAPSDEQKKNFTRVLKGHIAIAAAVFPKGTTGHQLDVLARQYLWKNGLDYRHGTGHGVGSYLSVHEGPQRISPAPINVPLEPGMIVSNEPGYYEDGAYGIRIENLIMVQEHPLYKNFLCFYDLTQVPYDLNLIDKTMLSNEEISWINNYHSNLRALYCNKLLDNSIQNWLVKATQSI